jgi:DNA-binding transcriptional ArsR family regulator
MKTLLHPSREEIALWSVLYALGDPIRLQMVRCLAETGNACCGSLSENVPKSTMARHFRVLREMGLINQELCGRQCINSLRREDLDARFPGLLDAILASLK